MVTSRSPDDSGTGTGSLSGALAGARLFSGRQDPTWPLPAGMVAELQGLWDRMEPSREPPPQPPALGYRGCFARLPGEGQWEAYGGIVTLASDRGAESRTDPGRAFEKAILATAPPDRLPPLPELH